MNEVSKGRKGAVAMTIAHRIHRHLGSCIHHKIREKILSKVIKSLINVHPRVDSDNTAYNFPAIGHFRVSVNIIMKATVDAASFAS